MIEMKKYLVMLLVLGLGLNLVKLNYAKPDEERSSSKMKVKFYTLDIENRRKGDFVGTAVVKEDGEIVMNILDVKLKEILTQPYKGLKGGRRGNEFVDEEITYFPGSVEHLEAIAIECYQFGYVAEIEKNNRETETKQEVER